MIDDLSLEYILFVKVRDQIDSTTLSEGRGRPPGEGCYTLQI